ncbi:HNH endonuclease [Natrinema sp. DC36]|uniref:HNH endonuclease n=1 Tax=Natrinema sp. DC36 TaxID=2878680 RepID=UPI001CEFEFE6|nr:HNH endonuclease [Natrinema sp. DC36]
MSKSDNSTENSTECPTCGDNFETGRAMKIHHSRTHGESLVETSDIECPTCGREDFQSERGMKTHHKKAHGESIAGVKTECSWCGDEIRVPPGNYRKCDHHFCTDKGCEPEWRKQFSGENHSQWKGGKQTYTCSNCGGEVTRAPADVNGENVFCNRDCYTDWKGDQMRGPDHHNWKGGYTQNKNWPEIRQRALAADGYQCQGCGVSEEEHRSEHGAGLSVHHIFPRMEFDDPHEADSVDNLVTLCRGCHAKWEGIPLRPELSD